MKLKTVGSDPEFFLVGENGVTVSQGVVPGTKTRPKKLKYGAVHRDNVLCELNPQPATNPDDFVGNLSLLREEVTRKFLRPHGLGLLAKASHLFEPDMLDHPEARTFGCSQDEGMWDRMQTKAEPHRSGLVRGAGGHIHLGIEGLEEHDLRTVISSLDMRISVPLVIKDPDKYRREFYGKAGCYRRKPYGIEYRTPSNVWCTSDNLGRWVYQQAQRAVEEPLALFPETIEVMVRCIDTSDTLIAEQLCTLFNLEIPA